MFETISEKLNNVLSKIGQKGRLREDDIEKALKEIRIALLEADVNFKVVKTFINRVKERSLDSEVLKSFSSGQQVIKITKEELTVILGGAVSKIQRSSEKTSVILVLGLNGSGKTTTTAKMSNYFKKAGQTSLMVAADLRRPAAIDQLVTLGKSIEIEVYNDPEAKDPVSVAKSGVEKAKSDGLDFVIVDTGGNVQINQDFMSELVEIKRQISPDEIILVLDSMTGQESVNVANTFNQNLELTGLVLTKLDGDARGGAALSIVSETGVPIKFLGLGEKLDSLEEFHPDRLSSRILGMGDVLTFIEKTEKVIDKQEALNLTQKIQKSKFDLEDFNSQLQQIQKMGSISQIMDMIPGISKIKSKIDTNDVGDEKLTKIQSIIFSMTPSERRDPKIIDGSRKRRIASGSGNSVQDVNMLLNQFNNMQKMMKQMSSGKGFQDISKMMFKQ